MMRAVVWALLAGLMGSPAAAGPVELTADQMRLFGVAAIAHGAADQALAIAMALLQRDPGDSAALTLKAQALRVKGDLAGSAAAARAAWAKAATPANRYGAATALAQALSLQGHRTLAQYWLRQAVQNAPTPATKAQATQDFAYVRDQNPLHLQFDASFRPSNNVNNGSRETLLGYLFGVIPLHLPPEFTPLSGYAWGAGLSGDYRLHETDLVLDSAIFAFNAQGVILSQAAMDTAPLADAANYAFQQVEAGWRHKQTLSFGLLTTEITLGHNWYGGANLSDVLTAGSTLDHSFADGSVLSLAPSLTRTMRIDRPESSATGLDLGADYRFAGPKGDVWQAGVTLSRSVSDDPGVDDRATGLSLGWQAAEPVLTLGLSANAGVTVTDYANSRHDIKLSLGVAAKVASVTYLGFSPLVSLDYAKNTSTFSYDNTETVGLGLSLKSNF